MLLRQCEVEQDEERLYLRQGHGSLQRDGFLTLHFQASPRLPSLCGDVQETPNLSESWQAMDKPEKDAAPGALKRAGHV